MALTHGKTLKVREAFNSLNANDKFTVDDLMGLSEVEKSMVSPYMSTLVSKGACSKEIIPNSRNKKIYTKLKDDDGKSPKKRKKQKTKRKMAKKRINKPTPLKMPPDTMYSFNYKPITADNVIIAEQIITLVIILKKENARLYAAHKTLTKRCMDLSTENKDLINDLDVARKTTFKYKNQVIELQKNSGIKKAIQL